MFTGIIDHSGQIIAIDKNDQAKNQTFNLTIQTEFNDFALGESIAVDGVCLTVTAFQDHNFCCQISPETANVSIAQYYKLNQTVNLERPLMLNSRLGGHYVLGHVDHVIRVHEIISQGEFKEIVFADVASTHFPYLIAKGSVAINGVSLTINSVRDGSFSVMLIPHTLEKTNLSFLQKNSLVNIEYDYLAKLVQNQLTHTKLVSATEI